MIFFQFSIQTKGLPVQNPLPIRSLYTVATPKAEIERAPSQVEAVVDSTKVVKNIKDAYVIGLAYYYDIKCLLSNKI